MIKHLALFLAMLMLCSLTACGADSEQPVDSTATTTTQDVAATTTTESTTTTQPTQAPVDYAVFCGRYSDTDTVEGPCYTVNITRVDNATKEIELSIGFVGKNSSPIYNTEVIIATVTEDHTVNFEWKDSWSNKGDGTLVLNPDDSSTVQLMMTVTEEAEVNRATLSTNGQYKTLNRR